MNGKRNEAQEAELIAFGNRWKLDKDLIICRGCKRGIIYCRRNEILNHAAGCKYADDTRNPWAVLHSITAENYE